MKLILNKKRRGNLPVLERMDCNDHNPELWLALKVALKGVGGCLELSKIENEYLKL